MPRRPALALLAAAISLLASSVRASAQDAYGAEISTIDNAFRPEVVRIEPGQIVEWTMDGRSAHTVEADDGAWASGNLDPGSAFERAFDEPGVFPFFCRYHGSPGAGMSGTVVVDDVPLPGPAGGVSPGREPVPGGFAPTIRVPADAPTVQAAVDAARPGGMVLIAPGVYRESVRVTTPYVTIRGEDRNRTILDGGFRLANGIHVIEADGVTIENLTARNFALNGFIWTSVDGFRGSYLTAHNNGDYGIFAFDSEWGQFEHSYAGGSPDAGFYIGQCSPCHALIIDVLAEHNALGFSGTNAGGDLAIVNSEWRENLAGIVPNTLDSESGPPQRRALIAGNHVHHNGSRTVDAKEYTYTAFGTGILVAGGVDNKITGNLVEDHETYGIGVIPIIDANLWVTQGNEISDNVVRRSGRADLALAAPSTGGDCFEGNDARSSSPPAIEVLYGCDGWSMRSFGGGDPAPTVDLVGRFLDARDGAFPHGDWRNQPAPPQQAQMPGSLEAPPHPAVPEQTVPTTFRIREVGSIAPALGPEVGREPTLWGVPLAASWWSLLLGLYGYLLPFALYATWLSVSVWDLVRRDDLSTGRRNGWILGVVLVPFAGPVLYLLGGGSRIPSSTRLVLVVGGLLASLLIAVLATLAGG
jgi:plastocyanin